jgi:hypothetical protein
MKKIKILAGLLLATQFSMAQFTTIWPSTTTSNSTSAGYIGIGTKPTAASSVLPAFNFHLHSVVDYITPGYSTPGPDGEGQTFPGTNFGKTVRFGLTNSVTGSTLSDGTIFQLSNNDFYLINQEAKNLSFTSGGVSLRVSGSDNRIYIGAAQNTVAEMAKFNVYSTENGMLIRSTATSALSYGLSVNVAGSVKAIQVLDQNNNKIRNFSVTGTGEVFARKYTTTLANIPDYVFADDYELMTFAELKAFIQTNKHLSNVPSASEYEANGVDLGELNRLLLEKVEELTLYILQMEERLKVVESAK